MQSIKLFGAIATCVINMTYNILFVFMLHHSVHLCWFVLVILETKGILIPPSPSTQSRCAVYSTALFLNINCEIRIQWIFVMLRSHLRRLLFSTRPPVFESVHLIVMATKDGGEAWQSHLKLRRTLQIGVGWVGEAGGVSKQLCGEGVTRHQAQKLFE